jgi:hypothetical protein
MGEAGERPWLLWVAASVAALVALVGVLAALAWMVPAFTKQGQVAGVDPQQLRSACNMAGRPEAARCESWIRLEALVREGQCSRAVQVASDLRDQRSASGLAAQIADVATHLVETRCATRKNPGSPPPGP